MNKYELNTPGQQKKVSMRSALRGFIPYLKGEFGMISLAVIAIFINGSINLVGPALMAYAIDTYVLVGDYAGVMFIAGVLTVLFAISMVAAYLQTRLMGAVAQRLLFTLRNAIFQKLQSLPVSFFQQNKTGDLIARINNDTDKLNQFFSQSLMQFIGNMFMMTGAVIFLLSINVRLGAATLAPAVFLLFVTQAVSAWIRRKNAASLQASGGMSAEIQESLQNFNVIVAFNRRNYFRESFQEANEKNFRTAVSAGLANTFFIPLYGFSSAVAQLIVLTYGIALITAGNFTVGFLVGYFTYVTRFYDPLRHIAALWASFQGALAAWDRITAILSMKSDLETLPAMSAEPVDHLLEFRDVHFRYSEDKEILHGISFTLEKGKTYALVGPTGGGKTTTASLMARLFDPSEGTVLMHGCDLRTYTETERAAHIGFILQEPFLFSGTVGENIRYGNEAFAGFTEEQLMKVLEEKNLTGLLSRFDQGLATPVKNGGESISLGQRQLIAFMRAVLRSPELLILDEATANVDTVTEQMLEEILKKLPVETTKVIIAHRLNTIENADEIFFVNAGEVVRAGNLDHAVEMLLHGKRES